MGWALLKGSAFVVNDKLDKYSLFEQIRQNEIANSFRLTHWGGSRHDFILGNGTFDLVEYRDLELVSDNALDRRLNGLTVRARFYLRTENAGTSVTPRIYNVTDAAALATGSAVTATTWTAQTIVLTLTAGTKVYRPQLTTNNGTNAVQGVCTLEIYGA